MSTIKDEKSAAKFHYKTVSAKVVAQSISFRVVSIYWQGVAPFPCLISACKGTDSPLEARALQTLRLIARQPPTSVTSLCSSHYGWPVTSTVGSIVRSTVKPMFTQFDCQSNSSNNCRISSWTDCSSSCQIHTQTV